MRPRRHAGDRGRQDDGAGPLRPHHRDGGADAVDRAEHIDPEGALPVLGRQVVDAAVRSEHARVADEHVEPAEALHRQGDDRFHVGNLADIREHRFDCAPRLCQSVHGRLK